MAGKFPRRPTRLTPRQSGQLPTRVRWIDDLSVVAETRNRVGSDGSDKLHELGHGSIPGLMTMDAELTLDADRDASLFRGYPSPPRLPRCQPLCDYRMGMVLLGHVGIGNRKSASHCLCGRYCGI